MAKLLTLLNLITGCQEFPVQEKGEESPSGGVQRVPDPPKEPGHLVMVQKSEASPEVMYENGIVK